MARSSMRAVDKTTPYLDAKLLAAPFADSEGSYQLCLRIASGGMATVYLAMYRGMDGLQRPVAVKLIHPHLAKHTEFVEMFFDEAQLAACIDHPGVCALYDFGRTHDSYFLAMEYLVGETFERLGSVLQERADATTMMRTPFFVSRLIADVAEALHAVHEARDEEGRPLEIVHRDVTPHNLFVLYDGSIRVTDFGIARSRDRVHQTQSGVLKGKIGYMAPEQLGQEAIDRRVDVWSVGVVLWELLANERLFAAPNVAATVDAVQHRVVKPPSQSNPFVPAALDAIALRALERDRSKRYQSMRELALDLEMFLSSRRDTVPAAEVTDWLAALLPGEATRRRDLVSRTRGMVPTSMPPPPLLVNAKDALSDKITLPHARGSRPRPKMLRSPWFRVFGSVLVLMLGALALYAAVAQRSAPLVNATSTEPASARRPRPIAKEIDHATPAATTAPEPQAPSAVRVEPPAAELATASSPKAHASVIDRAIPPRVRAIPTARPTPPAPREENGASASTALAARGQVFLTASEPAEVYFRGKRLGRAPLGISLPVGAQTLDVQPVSGAPAVSVSVDVKYGDVAMKRVTLPPSTRQ
jgi:serine/threonine-protein kinase